MQSPRIFIPQPIKNHWPLFVALFVAVLVSIWIFPKFVRMQDEGMLASAAMQVMNGKVLYRDVFEFWTPLSVYLTAGTFNLFGVTVAALRGFFVLLALLNTVAFYSVIRKIFISKAAQISSLLIFIVISYAFVGMNHHWLGMLFLLITMQFLAMMAESRRLFWGTLSGLSASLAFISMQLEGAIATILCAIVLTALFRSRGDLKFWIATILFWSVPILMVIGYFLSQGALTHLIRDALWFPLVQYRSVNGIFASGIQVSQLIILFVMWRIWLKAYPSISAKLWCYSAAMWQIISLLSSNTVIATRFSFFYVVMLIGTAAILWNKFQKRNNTAMSPDAISPTKILLGYSISTLLVISCSGFLLETITSWRNIYLANQQITSNAGIMYARPEVAQKSQLILDFVNSADNSNKSVYFGPFAAHYQFLSQRNNPTKYSQLTPKYNTEEMIAEAVSELDSNKTQLIVFLPQETPFAFSENNSLAQYVTNNYQKVKPLPFVTLLSSKTIFSGSYRRQQNNSPADAIWQRKE